MATMRGKLVMVDTNVLLSATNTARSDHLASHRVFSRALSEGIHLCTCGQILREYLVVATRPVSVNGLGLDLDVSLRNLSWFRRRMVFFPETEEVHQALLTLAGSRGIRGKHLHDGNIAALMSCSGIAHLATNNPEDFAAFPEFTILAPEDI
jgi:predicted nucleic acid-binding protein